MADQPSARRRFQFSLRMAILLMTLACVLAAWIGWIEHKARLDAASAPPKAAPPENSTVLPRVRDEAQPRDPQTSPPRR
jgi:hypothetical protein